MSIASDLMIVGGLSLVSGPTQEPLSVAEAALHCKVDSSDDSPEMYALIVAAREHCESVLDRKLITQTWDYRMSGFPLYGADLVLPYPPVSSITSVTYIDTAGASQTWPESSSGYAKYLPSGPQADFARIYPAYGVSYPAIRTQPGAVTVRFVCGYGAAGSDIPGAIRSAMLLLIGHWYIHREAVDTGINTVTSVVPFGVDPLLAPYRAG